MATIINHNIEAMDAYRNLALTNGMLARSLERLSSGYRINRASDDAAGLAISEKMRGQIAGMNAASKNAQDAISLVRTAEGALQETNADLIRMRELAVLASTDVLTSTDRLAYQNEFLELQKNIERISNTTEFNTKQLLNGTLSSATGLTANALTGGLGLSGGVLVDPSNQEIRAGHLIIQVGANVGQFQSIGVCNLRIGCWNCIATGGADVVLWNAKNQYNTDYMGGLNIGYSGSFMVGTATQASRLVVGNQYSASQYIYTRGPIDITCLCNARTALWRIDQAIQKTAAVRAQLGALENGLTSVMNYLAINVENTQAAESRIRDTDMAKEMTQFTKAQIMAQAGMAMLAQANIQPQNVLTLLR